MKYKLEFSPRADKDLEKLEDKDIRRILKKVYHIRNDPLHFLERLQGTKLWKLRVGDFRVICAIDVKRKIVFISKIGNRKNIYQRMSYHKYGLV